MTYQHFSGTMHANLPHKLITIDHKSIRLSRPLLCLVPPTLRVGTEINLGPGREHDLAIVGDIAMRESKGKRGRSANDGTCGGVLRSMAGAHELVVGCRPWDDATKMGAYGIKTVGLKSPVIFHDKVTALKIERGVMVEGRSKER